MKKLKKITEQSYILSEFGVTESLITINEDNTIVCLGNEILTFKSWDEFEKSIKFEIDNDDGPESENEEIILFNLPIKHKKSFNVDRDPISYTKSENSNIRYAAGYWGLKFDNGMTPAFCPKLSTVLMTEGSIGPFSTKLEMNNAISNYKFRGNNESIN